MNIHDVLVRVDKTGSKLEPGLAESWTVSEDGLTYAFALREALFNNGSPVTSQDAAFSLARIRDSELSLWSDAYKIIADMATPDPRTRVVTLSEPSAPFLTTLAMPGASIVSKAAMEAMGEEAYASDPVAAGAFMVKEWVRGERVTLERNPHYWEAGRVKLDGVEWLSVPDDNTRVLKVQAGEIDAAIFMPFAQVATLKGVAGLNVHVEPSTREDALLINHEHPALAKRQVREALDHAIDKQAIVDAVTFGLGEVANSYLPKGALHHNADNLRRPRDVEKAKALLAEAGESGLSITHLVNAGDSVDEQTAVLIQRQLAEAGVTSTIRKVDPSQQWDMLVAGEYDIAVGYWTNDILDPDQKTTFVVGHDSNMNYMTRYQNPEVAALVAAARVETDPAKREAIAAGPDRPTARRLRDRPRDRRHSRAPPLRRARRIARARFRSRDAQ